MAEKVTYMIWVMGAMLLFLLISTSFLTGKAQPEITNMLGGIIPGLTQSEKLSLEDGFKAIHVKVGVGGTPNLYEFHPTNEGAMGRKHYSHAEAKDDPLLKLSYFFFLKTWKTDKCTLFATGDTGIVTATKNPDMYIYYLNPGAQVKTSDTTLKNALFPFLSESGCEKDYGCDIPGKFTVCSNSKILARIGLDCDNEDSDIINQKFTTSSADNCVYDEEGCPSINGNKNCCALAAQDGTKYVYKPAYNIICGYEQAGNGWNNEANWYACTGRDKQLTTVQANGVQYTCGSGGWAVKSGGGVQILNPPELKYDSELGFHHTDLKFVLANNQNSEIKDVKITSTIADDTSSIDCSVAVFTTDCTSISKSYSSIGATSIAEFNSHGLTCPHSPKDLSDFCYKAKTFDVKVDYTIKENNVDASKSKTFKIECKNANPDSEDTVKCVSTEK